MNRCLIGTEGTARHFLDQGFLPATTGASALIKEQEDERHLKETAANQTGDMHAQHTQATCPYKLTALGKKLVISRNMHHMHTAFNQDGYFSCQMFVK